MEISSAAFKTGLIASLLIFQSNAQAEFLDDSHLDLSLRNFYFYRDFRQSGAATSLAREWAQGFALKFTSGYTEGPVGFGLDLTGRAGFKLDGGGGHVGSWLLPVGDDGKSDSEYSELRPMFKARLSQSDLTVGNMWVRNPLVQASDLRLFPQTYQGAEVVSREIEKLRLTVGVLNRLDERNSTDYTKISVSSGDIRGFSAPVREGTRFRYGGLDYDVDLNNTKTTASLWSGGLENYYRQTFIGLVNIAPLSTVQSLTTDLRFFKSSNDGTRYLNNIDSKTIAGSMLYKSGGHGFKIAYQKNSGDTGFINLDNTDHYLPNAVQYGVFVSKDESSWQLYYDYDFTASGIPGLYVMARYVKGSGIDRQDASEGKEWERDTDVGYIVQSGSWKGLNLRLRNATYRSNFASDLNEFRLIVNYNHRLF